MKHLWIILLCMSISILSNAQYKYGLKPTTFAEYKETVKANPNKALINLETYIPGLVMDIRYATTNNFTKEKIYNPATTTTDPVTGKVRTIINQNILQKEIIHVVTALNYQCEILE